MTLLSRCWARVLRFSGLASLALIAGGLKAQVYFSEIHYHPVEAPAFNADGTPVLDLTEDVHEFVELHNPGTETISLSGWHLTGGVQFTFPAGATIQPGQYLVVARDPARLVKVPVYQLTEASVVGPYTGQLSNNGETLRLRDAGDELIDAVTYSAQFPWAIGADALGADEEWTGLKDLNFQYTGRSLERVSFGHSGNDPANWLASPITGAPSPGRANAIQRSLPLPVVVQLAVYQNSDEQRLIRQNQPARIDATFSATNELGTVSLEYFVDNINIAGEPTTNIVMTATGDAAAGRFTALVPGLSDRSVVRYRILAARGGEPSVVSPRADDPFPWHAYFVTPNRTSTKPVYDCFISAASLARLNNNISGSPKRVTLPDPPGNPRDSWNATEPGIFIHDGEVRDIRVRYHGSRYNRSAGRGSYKWFFPRYHKFQGTDSMFETDKGDDFVVGHGLFVNAGMPVSTVRYVDLYLNGNAVLQRLEQGEFNGDLLDAYHKAQQKLNPGAVLEPSGEYYKSVGTIEEGGEGPYGRGDGRRLAKLPTWPALKMYEWTYSQQNSGWRGHTEFAKMIDAMWVARGDTPSRPAPQLPALRTFFETYFDIDAILTYVAVENWACPWDDTTQNHFLWRKSNGKWSLLPWDCDAWFGRGDNTPASSSIYIGEVGDPNNNYRGPNFFKDGILKTFRQEYKERLYLLNNTFLHPENISAMGFGSIRAFADARFAAVNQQCGFGPFQRPARPVNLNPAPFSSVVPNATLRASAYVHSANPASPHTRTIWEIRRDDGTYQAPLFRETSTTNLTSLPIPFPELVFGRTYFWRCTYLDKENHPSLISVETGFTFGAPNNNQTNLVSLIRLDATTTWKYNQSGDNLGTGWSAPKFDDTAWPSGPALLAQETAALPEPIRTRLTLGPTTFYFRNRFQYGGPSRSTVRLRTVIDDGAVLYLNGVRIWNTRVTGEPPAATTLADANVADAVYEGPFDLVVTNLVAGENVLAAEVHQSSTASSDIVFGISLDALSITLSKPEDLVLNEVLADNRTAVANAGEFPDYVELYNASDQGINLAGYALSDSVLNPGRFVFPPGVRIPAKGYLQVWCDDAQASPGLHTGFGLDASGQTLLLLAPSTNGFVVRDSLEFGPQVADLSIGRRSDGSRVWELGRPTMLAVNVAQPTAGPDSLRINEWMASPVEGEDWFEVYNPQNLPVALGGMYLTDDLGQLAKSVITPLSFVPANGFVTFVADGTANQGGNHANFKLGAGGDSIILVATNRLVLNSVVFGPQSTGVSEGRLPDGAAKIVRFPTTATPGEPNYLPISGVFVNEVLSHSDPPAEDAIELLNTSGAAVDISGWYLSDDPLVPGKYRFPAGTLIPAGGFRVVYEYQFKADTNAPTSFALNSAHGDGVIVTEVDGGGEPTGRRQVVKFGAAFNGVSFGRLPTSQGVDFVPLNGLSFGDTFSSLVEFRAGTGRANSGPRISPMVISEIMYHPPDAVSNGQTNDSSAHEYIELRNRSSAAVSLFDPMAPTNAWRVRGGVQLNLPSGLTLPANGVLLLVNFEPTNAAALASFRAAYPKTEGSQLVGPYAGKLANNRDRIELLQPDHPQTLLSGEEGFVPYVVVDHVAYADSAPWPVAADGLGSSLHRIDLASYGNDPVNWKAALPTPGDGPAPDPTTDTDHDGLPDAWERAFGLDPLNPADGGLDSDVDGMTNLQEFLAGTDPRDSTSGLAIEAVRLPPGVGGAIELRFPGVAMKRYQIEYRNELGEGVWAALSGIIELLTAGPVVVTDILPTVNSQRYYRVRIR